MIEQLNPQVIDSLSINSPIAEMKANPRDVINFENEMNAESPEIKIIDSQSMQVPHDSVAEGNHGITDTIVQKLEDMRLESKRQLHEINNAMGKAMNDGVNSKELLDLQVKVFQFTYQTHIATKVSDKTNEGIKTLFRQQG